MGGVKNIWGSNMYYDITTLSLFQFFRISSANVNASVVTWHYPQIYNFSFRNDFLETLCKCIYSRILTQILGHLLWKTNPLAGSPPCSILVNNT